MGEGAREERQTERTRNGVNMNGLTHIQPVQNADGHLRGLIAVDNRGTIYFGELTYQDGRPTRVKWKQLEELS